MIHYTTPVSARRRCGGARASARREHVGAVLHTYSRAPLFRLGRVLSEAVAVARRSRTPRFPGFRAGVVRRRWLVPDRGVHNTSNGGRRPSDVAAFSQKPSPSHAGRGTSRFRASTPARRATAPRAPRRRFSTAVQATAVVRRPLGALYVT